MNENQNVNTNAKEEVKQENPTPEKNVIDTKRRIKLQSPITIVHVPKKERKQKTSAEEPAAEDEKPKEKGEKLKKIKRIVTGIGLVGGAALVGIGSYLKGRDDGSEALANDIRDTIDNETQDNEPAPDPAGVSEESGSSND